VARRIMLPWRNGRLQKILKIFWQTLIIFLKEF
jgi:hypothetical protein